MRGGRTGLALTLSATLLAGCAALHSRLRPPGVSLVSVTLVRAGLLEQDYRLRVHLHNPNDVPLAVTRMRYRVRLDGHPFATGASEHGFRLPAHGGGMVDLDARTDLLAFVGRLSRRARKEPPPHAIGYAISGSATLGLAGSPVVRFSHRGSVPVHL